MSYELKKPYTQEQKTKFIFENNHKKQLKLKVTNLFLFALEPNEIMGEKEIEIEIPDYETVIEEYQEPVYKTVEQFDEDGNSLGFVEELDYYETKTREKLVQVGSHIETMVVPYPVLNPNYESEQLEAKREQFNKDFFLTSLGYIRRKVTMKTGETKDFLGDLLPVISMGVNSGQAVTIIAYKEPDFTQDVTDWEALQEQKTVTPEFVQECFARLSSDFTG